MDKGEGLLTRKHPNYPTAAEREREDTLAAFLGEERRAEVMAEMRPPVHSIADLVHGFMKRLNPPEQELYERIRQHWEELVGGNAKMIRPLLVRGNSLVLEVLHPSYRMVFQTPQVQSQVLARVRELTDGKVSQIAYAPAGRRGAVNLQEELK